MWGYIVFAFPLIHPFVHTYVHSSFRNRVKVFALKFIRPHIYTPDIRSMWGYNVFAFLFIRTFVFPQGQSFCVKVYKTSYFEDPLMDFIHIRPDGRYRSKVFISTIPNPEVTLGSRSRT